MKTSPRHETHRRLFAAHTVRLWGAATMIGAMTTACSPAQSPSVPPPVPLTPDPNAASAPAPVKLGQQELDQLLAPIALYPDALIALILPASTVPSDVVMGARYLNAGGNPNAAGNQPWDESVRSLARYPDVLKWMDQNLEWTTSVGEAFVEQPADVMNSIQALRAQAQAAGNLVDTPQQKVVVEKEVIRIVPADPEVIYVPVYDPQVVYVQTYQPSYSVISFGLGFAVGAWLNYDFDWNRRCVYRGDWRGWDYNYYNNRGWYGGGGGGNTVNVVNIDINNASVWQPSNDSLRQFNQRQRNNNGNSRFVSRQSVNNVTNVDRRDNNTNSNDRRNRFDPNQSTLVPRTTRLNRTNDERVRAVSNRGNDNNANDRRDSRNDGDRPGRDRTPPTPDLASTDVNQRQGVVSQPGDRNDGNTGSRNNNNDRPRNTPSKAPVVPGQIPAPDRNRQDGNNNNPRRDGSRDSSNADRPRTPQVTTQAPTVPGQIPAPQANWQNRDGRGENSRNNGQGRQQPQSHEQSNVPGGGATSPSNGRRSSETQAPRPSAPAPQIGQSNSGQRQQSDGQQQRQQQIQQEQSRQQEQQRQQNQQREALQRQQNQQREMQQRQNQQRESQQREAQQRQNQQRESQQREAQQRQNQQRESQQREAQQRQNQQRESQQRETQQRQNQQRESQQREAQQRQNQQREAQQQNQQRPQIQQQQQRSGGDGGDRRQRSNDGGNRRGDDEKKRA